MCMVTGKREDQYRYILQEIKRGVLDATEAPFTPHMVITDFEVGLMNAIRSELPNALRRGCYFHFCQSLWRKVAELGLKVAFNVHPLLQKVLGNILSLGHLPVAHIAMNFQTYTNSRHVQEMVQQYPALRTFFAYVEQTYVNGPVFSVHFWNEYNRTMETRTNNYCKTFHNRWNKCLAVPHPNIWRVIRRIKDEGSRTLNLLQRVERGDRLPRRRRKWRELARRITRVRREFERGDRNLISLWNAAVHFS
ncbi:uncharacterized protein LOC129273512 [Lytechinus pictus]|uniref:uncharacterized protein LOC129273512 n=1 Tax=Lytechinus pictus TaxID=7653 RepID=UPI0030B9C8BE